MTTKPEPAENEVTEAIEAWRSTTQTQRAVLLQKVGVALPEPVRSITSCEVRYVIHPSEIPLRNISFTRLRSVLASDYGLNFRAPDLGRIPVPDSADELAELILGLREPELRFEHGLLKIDRQHATVVSAVEFTREGVFTKVTGPTEVGEQLACELIPLLWALVGVQKRWEDVQSRLQVVQYGTGTRVKIPKRGAEFLSAELIRALARWSEPGGLATKMGERTEIHQWVPSPFTAKVTYSLDELQLLFHRSDIQGGPVRTRLRIGVDAAHEQGSDIITVVSELPLVEHIELVQDLLGNRDESE